MLYHDLVEKIKQTYEPVHVEGIPGHLACQFNVSGEAEGAFYLQVTDGKVEVMPYEYYDRDVLFFLPTEVLIALFEGRLKLETAIEDGSIGVEGDEEKAVLLEELIGNRTAVMQEADEADTAGARVMAEKMQPSQDAEVEESQKKLGKKKARPAAFKGGKRFPRADKGKKSGKKKKNK